MDAPAPVSGIWENESRNKVRRLASLSSWTVPAETSAVQVKCAQASAPSAARSAVLVAEPLCRHCAEAGRVKAAALVDHIVPRPAGAHDLNNLQPLCQRCHAVKTASERDNPLKKLDGGLREPAGVSRAHKQVPKSLGI